MWSSGQPQPSWGWPPPAAVNNNQYNDQEFDPAQGWAAAAAMWAQQRQLQDQCQNGNGPPSKFEKPPEPPGPPPIRPPLPPLDVPPLIPSVQNIEVHDYQHGKAQVTQTQTTEVIDYQHGKISDPLPATTVDYSHMKAADDVQPEWEVTSDNWHEHQPLFYNGGWNQDGWNGDQMNYYAAAAQHFQNEYATSAGHNDEASRSRRSTPVSSGGHRSEKHTRNEKQSSFPVAIPKGSSDMKTGVNTTSMDPAEMAKRTKVLPLWLRQGLEKMEREKKKQLEKNKTKDETSLPAILTGIAEYKDSPKSSPEREEKHSDSEEETETKISSFRNAEKSVEQTDPGSAADESEEEDEEEKFQRMMLKVKTWMTEILLGVTNAEIKEVSKEVYFELKRSAKAKATQVRRSGGLEALRSVGLGVDGHITTSESESEEEIKPSTKIVETREIDRCADVDDALSDDEVGNEEPRSSRESSTQRDNNQTASIKRIVNKSSSESDSSPLRETQRNEKQPKSNRKFREEKQPLSTSSSREPPLSSSRLPISNSLASPSKSVNIPTKSRSPPAAYRKSNSEIESKFVRNGKDGSERRVSDERIQYYKRLALESRKEERCKSSSTGDEDDDDEEDDEDTDESERESESEDSDSSDDSEEKSRRTKSKHRRRRRERSDSSSPRRHKKSKRHRRESSSDDSDRRKRRKRKGSSSSSDRSSERSSSYRKSKSSSSKSSGKKHKRKTKSPSRSPSRSKRKR